LQSLNERLDYYEKENSKLDTFESKFEDDSILLKKEIELLTDDYNESNKKFADLNEKNKYLLSEV